jgi:hypothetical protein
VVFTLLSFNSFYLFSISSVSTATAESSAMTDEIADFSDYDTINNIKLSNGTIQLNGTSKVPWIYEGSSGFGIYVSKPIKTSEPFSDVSVDVTKTADNPETNIMVEVEASQNGALWTERAEVDSADQKIVFTVKLI